MRKISIVFMTCLSIILLLSSGCHKEQSFVVEGVISDAEDQVMYLENVGISSVKTLDSIKLAKNGKFRFTKPRPEFPDFYRLRLNNQLINFAIDSTETVSIEADANTFATSYKVEGSENNKAIKNITLAQLDANQAISKLKMIYNEKQIEDTTMNNQVAKIFKEYKDTALKYIYSAPMSTVAYYALFQQIDGMLLFDLYDKVDSRAYGAVATSYDHFYPESPRAAHLHNLALQSIKVIRSQRPINLDNIETTEISYMDVSLPDEHGNTVKLSDVSKGSVTIVNFTAYQTEWSPSLNMEFGRLYSAYASKGLKLYQISLDTDIHFWRNAASNLPWSCVRDPETVYSKVASLYNVKQLPAIFILDKKGNLVKRVEDIRNLEKDLKALL